MNVSVNSICYKCDHLVDGIKGKVDVLMMTETKLDDYFSTMQFNIEGYYAFRQGRNEYGGGILLHVRDDIP